MSPNHTTTDLLFQQHHLEGLVTKTHYDKLSIQPCSPGRLEVLLHSTWKHGPVGGRSYSNECRRALREYRAYCSISRWIFMTSNTIKHLLNTRSPVLQRREKFLNTVLNNKPVELRISKYCRLQQVLGTCKGGSGRNTALGSGSRVVGVGGGF
ncbi:hypothetical protein FF38_13228 [Lucilia cuprina]|uniref:Uncharacterized protein n=1 Tax=Lucilia cuprina TaxID=7375 RepID=A0A0L0BX71_LUCCU|nr:hypothetical protein FF38_13228 [Lucilia cuprina]